MISAVVVAGTKLACKDLSTTEPGHHVGFAAKSKGGHTKAPAVVDHQEGGSLV